ncbi:hypothetical protein [Stutzerimonas chloritidismutans]|uniref:hypothetical protein n=1 Tax=Stutzerimonas chloritidismutans TaxID=203192 RepID=UPI0028A84CFE|nr:hypothetical protein [Stutzerimonas chloritidismutans]
MAILSEYRSAARWLISLSHRLFTVVPWFTLSSVAATLLSQLALLLAFVLPLKVILLLGSDNIPAYFPEELKVFGRQTLILSLSGLSIALFFVHLLAERVIEKSVSGGARRLLAQSRKMELFDNQDEVAEKAYQRFSRAFASAVLLFFFCPLFIGLNPYLGLVFFGYVIAVLAACLLVAAFNDSFRARWLSGKNQLPSILTGVGFLLCFSYMVAEFLWLEAPSVLVAVICLILMRQLFKHVVSIVAHTIALAERRRQLSALFFHGHRLVEPSKHSLDGLWTLAVPATRDEWLLAALDEVVGGPLSIRSTYWLQLGVADVLAYRVDATFQAIERQFLIKVFERNRRSAAKHEATLLVKQDGLPAPELLGVTDVANHFHCHVFAFDKVQPADTGKVAGCCESVRSQLLACAPDDELKAIYIRSKPTLGHRIGRDSLIRLHHLIAQPAQRTALVRFDQRFDEIRTLVNGLPLAYVNPDIRRGPVFLDGRVPAVACHWARWTLEPVGCGWPVDKRGMSILPEAHALAVAQRADMAAVSLPLLKLAALLYAFEKSCKQQNYLEAADLLGDINAVFDVIGA